MVMAPDTKHTRNTAAPRGGIGRPALQRGHEFNGRRTRAGTMETRVRHRAPREVGARPREGGAVPRFHDASSPAGRRRAEGFTCLPSPLRASRRPGGIAFATHPADTLRLVRSQPVETRRVHFALRHRAAGQILDPRHPVGIAGDLSRCVARSGRVAHIQLACQPTHRPAVVGEPLLQGRFVFHGAQVASNATGCQEKVAPHANDYAQPLL